MRLESIDFVDIGCGKRRLAGYSHWGLAVVGQSRVFF